ncbi:ABC transporter ATP-binding protein [Staphylococcus epidermidis]|jgi:ABC-2 type transport system ATP-binding protein|uniref:ABC transporter ATP-binding protein n=10 Tax=root TaxID=1 RepID=A0A2G7HWX2_STAEP|nr:MULTISPECIES: ABC transporter ATP-binding protein [Staphylococcus]EHQ76981.1 ABC transporter, ATP-binding protein EcsA [Staphylococcus epidermidis VCU057]EHR90636.1 ABC transporter, ATP-binding protein EcsA [Staphylococcus epidermidis VCU123]EID37426.1 ABC transporter, ATP-binding protein EcsA [Staphylococcus epidermidis IS-250]EJD81525.1 ABC transporter, ATP-binding protein EcsA [Staphylococcus epidermidis NIHLM088]EJD86241.1 ABC transporter, ATP-binding protein EcsA [Staphylococcus epider
MTVKVEHLTGGYGKKPVIKDLNFELEKGEIVGLIGLNGAGKSTTIKHMLGLINPMEGKLSISNIKINEDIENYRRKLSYIPESPVIYDELTLEEHIEMTAMAYQLSREEAMRRAKPLLKVFRLENELKVFPSHFSKGMKQKVMIICAFIVDPELYIIDEPFLGLDPLGIQSMLDLMVEKRNENRTVLMSTHILATAERYCDRFIILDKGEIVAFGNLDELREQTGLKDKTLDDIYIHVTQGSSAYE